MSQYSRPTRDLHSRPSTPRGPGFSAALFVSMVALIVSMGCTDGDASGPDGGDGKADSFDPQSLPALEPVSLEDLVQCFGVMDTSTDDPFFQRHQLRCTASTMPAGLEVDRISIEVTNGDLSFFENESIVAADFAERATIIGVRNEHFPLRLRITIPFRLRDEDFGEARNWGFEQTLNAADLEALTEEAPIRVGLPFELWPIALYPTVDLTEAWAAGDQSWLLALSEYDFPLAGSAEPTSGPAATEIRFSRYQSYNRSESPDLRVLPRTVSYYPMPLGGLETPATLTVHANADPVSSPLTGPGYYLVGRLGSAIQTATTELPDLTGVGELDAGPARDGGPPPILIDGGVFGDAGPPADPDAGVDAGPPCAGTCSTTEVCIAGGCVLRSTQTQQNCSSAADRACDLGEDGDCATGNVCVAGFCRRLTCQQQQQCSDTADRPCDDDDADCAAGNTCVARFCRRLTCQQQQYCSSAADRPCDDDDADCRDGNICVARFCRLHTCQQQQYCSSAADRPCDGDDNADCRDGNVCVTGFCRLRTCQQQQYCSSAADRPCDDDNTDCRDGNVCVAGFCRQLSCQRQQYCSSPTDRPCDGDDADCREGNACLDNVCQNVSCP